MSARATFRIPNFEKCDVTMSITMTVGECRQVLKRLNSEESNGQWYFVDAIKKAVEQFDQSFYAYESPPENQS